MDLIQANSFYLATPPIEAFANKIRQWFLATIPGGVVYGPSRVGKTSAIEYVLRTREAVFGYNIPLFKVEWKRGRLTESAFYERLLVASDHALPTARTRAADLEKRLIEYLASSVIPSGTPCLVWFIDDAHFLTVDDFGWLMNIQNALTRRKIRMYTFLVGEPRLRDTRETFIVSGDAQIIGRFMWSQYEFPHLKSAEDLAFVLKGYDIYRPSADSSVSLTEALVPQAWKGGWRLMDQAKTIWEPYVATRRAATCDKPNLMSMQACTILVAQLLRWLAKRDGVELVLDKALVEKAVELVT